MRYRIARSEDLPTCVALLSPGFRASRTVRARLIDLWEQLRASDPTSVLVIEDPSRPHPSSIEACGLSTFVTESFANTFLSAPQPYLSAHIYERMLDGQSPILTPAQIREANSSGGLSRVVLHFGLANHDLTNERTRTALHAGSLAFFFVHGGYRLNLILNEVYGRQHADYMTSGGFRQIADFDGHPETRRSREQPFLFALRREWVMPGAVNQLAFLFGPAPPRLALTPGEQRVLLRALLNESDREIAANMGVSIDAVKKTWRRVFDRIAAVLPHLIESTECPSAGDTRGAAKRRHVVDYLRTNLAELRPHR